MSEDSKGTAACVLAHLAFLNGFPDRILLLGHGAGTLQPVEKNKQLFHLRFLLLLGHFGLWWPAFLH